MLFLEVAPVTPSTWAEVALLAFIPFAQQTLLHSVEEVGSLLIGTRLRVFFSSSYSVSYLLYVPLVLWLLRLIRIADDDAI